MLICSEGGVFFLAFLVVESDWLFLISATKKPRLGREYTYPSAMSWAYAFSMVITLIPRFFAKFLLEGSLLSVGRIPLIMSFFMHLYR